MRMGIWASTKAMSSCVKFLIIRDLGVLCAKLQYDFDSFPTIDHEDMIAEIRLHLFVFRTRYST